MVEQRSPKPWVEGSNPFSPATTNPESFVSGFFILDDLFVTVICLTDHPDMKMRI